MENRSRSLIETCSRNLYEYAVALATEACYVGGVLPGDLVLHSDNGAPMKGASMLATLQKLGVVPSFSRPSVSDDNPFSESLFRTLKYRPHYPEQAFSDLSAARAWMERFAHWYNHEHRHSALRFVTPGSHRPGDYPGRVTQGPHPDTQSSAGASLSSPATPGCRWPRHTRSGRHNRRTATPRPGGPGA